MPNTAQWLELSVTMLKWVFRKIEPDSKRELLTRIISTGKNVPGKTAPHLVYLKRDL
jgi:hypothetical protein